MTKAAAVSDASRRLTPLEPLSPTRAPRARQPRRIVLWDEVGEMDPALESQQPIELASLSAISHLENLAVACGSGALGPLGS